jgi:hypothetical protein
VRPNPYEAPGLAANWLNGWLAAVGITVLLPGARLAWSVSPSPSAVVWFSGDLADAVAAALPSIGDIDNLSIARHHPGALREMGRTVSEEVFRDRATLARTSADLSLDITVTDLSREENASLAHGPLDPPVPKGITLHERLRATRLAVEEDVVTSVSLALEGRGRRIPGNGLGFDHRRFPAGANVSTQPFVDPVVEVLAFSGMSLLPVRGDGGARTRQRGWTDAPSRRGSFTWPTWSMPLDRWAVDALLDRYWALDPYHPRQDRASPGRLGVAIVPTANPTKAQQSRRAAARRLGVTGAFASVARQPKSSSDTGRGYASERAW